MATATVDVEKTIEHWTDEFIADTQKRLISNLDRWTTESLEWLMMEHFQFSYRNCQLLWDAAEKVGEFDTDAVKKELIRNYNEERDHAAMYKRALKKVGCDVDLRKHYAPTDDFLKTAAKLCERDPSAVLGTMYSTESAAVFEHVVFREISKAVIARRNLGVKGNDLVAFHDLHLGGVEQSHRDELGIFLRGVKQSEMYPSDGTRPTIDPKSALEGGRAAVDAMVTWWNLLLKSLHEKTRNVSTAC